MKIETEEQYHSILETIEEMWETVEELPKEDQTKFKNLCDAVKDYEDIHYPIPEPEENE